MAPIWTKAKEFLERLFCCFCMCHSGRKTDEDWAPTEDAGAQPAELKISVNNSRALEIKIVYNVNSALRKQLYEVDHCFAWLPQQSWGSLRPCTAWQHSMNHHPSQIE